MKSGTTGTEDTYHRDKFPLNDLLIKLTTSAQADLTDQQRQRVASRMSINGILLREYNMITFADNMSGARLCSLLVLFFASLPLDHQTNRELVVSNTMEDGMAIRVLGK